MLFREEEFVERETEIAGYLVQEFSLKSISQKTGLSKKLLEAHIRNMMEKLKVSDVSVLVKLLKRTE